MELEHLNKYITTSHGWHWHVGWRHEDGTEEWAPCRECEA